jgi:hypothetical protein
VRRRREVYSIRGDPAVTETVLGKRAGGKGWQRVEDSWPERGLSVMDGRFRNGKWEEKDLSDGEMRLMDGWHEQKQQNEEAYAERLARVLHGCCLDSLQGATASIDEPAALWDFGGTFDAAANGAANRGHRGEHAFDRFS